MIPLQNTNTCPIDRRPFSVIFIRNELHGSVVLKVAIEDARLALDDESDDDDGAETDETFDETGCEVCGQGDRPDRMLLCDDCDAG